MPPSLRRRSCEEPFERLGWAQAEQADAITREVVVLDNKEHLARITTHDARSGLSLLPIALADLRALKGQQRRRLATGITALAEDYDLVVIDGGALLEDEAVMSLVPATDQVILVARAHETRPAALATASDTLISAGANLRGTILTMASERPQ